ncbi:MAG: acetylornithine transaminase [Candidatus Dormibacteria bacterium]
MSEMTATGVAALSAAREREATYLMSTYVRQPVMLVRGDGCEVIDAEGRRYLDLVAGIAVDILGHGHPALLAAIGEQAERLVHTSNLYYTEPQLELAERLVESAFPGRVFLCNSGAEANEAAIKLARKWGRRHRDGATTIVCAQGAFHGRTMGALAATGTRRYQEDFEPLPAGFVHVPFDDAAAIAAAIDESVCAVLLETLLGESGVVPMSDDTLRAVRRSCDEAGVLLILDEIQTGMGRTGRMWSHQHAGVTPDVMTIAKGLGGGFPIGALLATAQADVFEPGDHGSTFGGNPLASAAACAVFRTIDKERLVERAAGAGARLAAGLRELGARGAPIASVRGRGLMLAAVLEEEIAPRVVRAGLETGVLVNAVGNGILRLVPPLTITDAEVDEAVRRIGQAFEMARTEGGA